MGPGSREENASKQESGAPFRFNRNGAPPKKVDPPGGTTGRVGCGTGWMRRPCRTQIHRNQTQLISVTAGTHAADVVAVRVELANEAAAAIAVVVVTVVAGGDRASDNRSTNEA